ncbi:MAG: RNA 2',3'-cyclic phosphodiesterase [Candidatus Aenigmarchaeota archaeon]|nr:RNA 2',3'-cyclic phosphodiesterase [Candidatus Aenigmarchaeota archaeon]
MAIDIDSHVKVNVKVTQDHVKESEADVKVVEPENLHFTVKFLGNVDESAVKRIIGVLTPLLEGEKSSKVSVKGVGFFGHMKAPRVLWVGVGEGKTYIEGIFSKISAKLEEIGIKSDGKEAVPHITVGRVRSGRNINKLEEIILKERETLYGETLIDAVKLKSSVLTPRGPRYVDVASFPLKKQ